MADQENELIDFDEEALEEEVGNTIFLEDEDGNEVETELLAVIEYEDGNNYAVLLPVDEEGEGVVIMQVVEVEEDEALEGYLPIEDEDLLNEIFEIFQKEFEDVFDYEDEED